MPDALRYHEFVDARGTTWMIRFVSSFDGIRSSGVVVREGLATTVSVVKPPESLTDDDVRAAVDRLLH